MKSNRALYIGTSGSAAAAGGGGGGGGGGGPGAADRRFTVVGVEVVAGVGCGPGKGRTCDAFAPAVGRTAGLGFYDSTIGPKPRR